MAVQTKNKKRTHREWELKLSARYSNEYISLSDYSNSTTKIVVKHLLCNHQWETFPPVFLKHEIPCANCRKIASNKEKENQLREEVSFRTRGEYSITGVYKGAKEPIEVLHNDCHHTFRRTPSKLKTRNILCPLCHGSVLERHGDWSDYVFSEVGEEYTFLEDYITATKKIKVVHNLCGNEYKVAPNKFQMGRRCPRCFGTKKKTTKEFTQEIEELHGGEYSLAGEYETAKNKIEMVHNKCGNHWATTPDSILRGSGCPLCASSKGEREILKVLSELNVVYKAQFSFQDLADIDTLYFDFAIFDKFNSLICLIEYDGIQHFEPVEHFGGSEKFEDNCRKDSMKDNYCEKNEISLLRIPYWKFHKIDEIVEGFIKNQEGLF